MFIYTFIQPCSETHSSLALPGTGHAGRTGWYTCFDGISQPPLQLGVGLASGTHTSGSGLWSLLHKLPQSFSFPVFASWAEVPEKDSEILEEPWNVQRPSPWSLHTTKGFMNPMLTGLDGKRNTLSLCEATKTQGSFVIACILSWLLHSQSPFTHCTLGRSCLFLFRERQTIQRVLQLPSATPLNCLCVFTLSFSIPPPPTVNPSARMLYPVPLSVLYLCSVNCSLPKKIHSTLLFP